MVGSGLDDATLFITTIRSACLAGARRWLTTSAILPAVIRLRVVRIPRSAMDARAAVGSSGTRSSLADARRMAGEARHRRRGHLQGVVSPRPSTGPSE
jgi:hypothetical protein